MQNTQTHPGDGYSAVFGEFAAQICSLLFGQAQQTGQAITVTEHHGTPRPIVHKYAEINQYSANCEELTML